MQLKVEGILIAKAPWRERDVRGTLLLRSGQQITAIFYGGQGGGAQQKASTLELGNMLHLEISAKSAATQDLWTAHEWKVLWASEKLRHHWPSFCLLCFYLEVLKALAPKGVWDEAWGTATQQNAATEEFKGLFTVASNAVFQIEEAHRRPQEVTGLDLNWHWAVFLGKLLFALGWAPRFGQCCFCGQALGHHPARWLAAEGGFACANCFGQNLDAATDSWHQLWPLWAQEKYPALIQMVHPLPAQGLALSEYFFYQSSLTAASLKSWPLLLAAGIGPHCRG